jgi:hypothetical protein
VLHVAHGHHAAALAHLANVSYRLGKKMSVDEVKERLSRHARERLRRLPILWPTLEANKVDLTKDMPSVGPWLEFDPGEREVRGRVC